MKVKVLDGYWFEPLYGKLTLLVIDMVCDVTIHAKTLLFIFHLTIYSQMLGLIVWAFYVVLNRLNAEVML